MDPMSIALVRERVFSFCSRETLKNCRFVSKEWHHDSLKHWRDKAVLCLSSDEIEWGCSGWISLEEYLKLFKSDDDPKTLQLRKYPFRNFCIRSGFSEYLKDSSRADAKPIHDNARHVILDGYKGDYFTFTRFLSKFTSLKSLEVIDLHLKNDDVPFEQRNIKSLKIKFRSTAKITETTDYPTRWKTFVQFFPKMESLSIEHSFQHCKTRWPVECYHILESLKNIEGLPSTLKELEIVDLHKGKGCKLYKAILNSIASCNFPLERITLDVTWDESDSSTTSHLRALVESCKETLRFFRVSIHDASSDSKPPILELPKLEEVHIVDGLPWGLDFLSTLELPQLKKLTVEHFDKNVDEVLFQRLFPTGRWVHGKLETLEFLHPRWTPGPSIVRALACMMPNLTHLTIPLDIATFSIVCEGFERLKSLHIINAQNISSELDLDDETLTAGVAYETPNITHLLHLTHLHIARRNDPKFTFRSVRDGFLHLHKLEYLSVAFKVLAPHAKTLLLNHLKKRHGFVHFQDQEDAGSERCGCTLRIECGNCKENVQPELDAGPFLGVDHNLTSQRIRDGKYDYV